MTAGLTVMQSRTLAFIRTFVSEHQYSPTYDEIAAALGLASKSGVYRLVTALEERGRVRKWPDRARSIEILETTSDFHLKRIIEKVERSGFIAQTDPIIEAAQEAVGGR